MTPGKFVALLFGIVLAPAAIGLIVGGIALVVAFGTLRNGDGYLESIAYDLRSGGFAVTSPAVAIAPHPGDWWPTDIVAELRLDVTPAGSTPVFIGIGPATDVARYLAGVAHDEVRDFGTRRNSIRYRTSSGTTVPAAPSAQPFWIASVEGTGTQRLDWEVERGAWTIVVMNADASAGVDVESVGAVRIPILLAVGIGILIGGLILAGIVTGLLVYAFRRRPAGSGEWTGSSAAGPAAAWSSYPLVLEGRIDEPLSRGLWLIKWFLALPHFFALAFLWLAFLLLTIVAFFAILFTGRYPRGIFDFNVGVLRWTWRVGFYATSVLGTDRYPPFSLADDPGYPARLDVAYPEAELSRGLVLVKWWLLAIPHYIIVGFFTTGLIWWTTDIGDGDRFLDLWGGLIGALAIIAGVVLLFSRRYAPGLFDLLMGLNRWVFRVAAYAALMRDEYPPFRLDLGGSESAAVPSTAPPAAGRPASPGS